LHPSAHNIRCSLIRVSWLLHHRRSSRRLERAQGVSSHQRTRERAERWAPNHSLTYWNKQRGVSSKSNSQHGSRSKACEASYYRYK
jgi:hypothetical protein